MVLGTCSLRRPNMNWKQQNVWWKHWETSFSSLCQWWAQNVALHCILWENREKPVEGTASWHLTAPQHLWGVMEEMEMYSSQQFWVGGKDNEHKLQQERFRPDIKNSFPKGTVRQQSRSLQRLYHPHPWKVSSPDGSKPWAACSFPRHKTPNFG